MSDELSKREPIPVLPLDYAGGQSESQRRVLRLIVWTFVIWQISSVVHYAADAGCYFWEEDDTATLRKLIKPIPLVIELPGVILSVYLIANSPAMLSLSDKGRRWIRGGAIAKAVLSSLVSIALAINAVVDRRVFWYGSAYGTNSMMTHFLSIVFTILEYGIVNRIFAASDV